MREAHFLCILYIQRDNKTVKHNQCDGFTWEKPRSKYPNAAIKKEINLSYIDISWESKLDGDI